MLRVALLSRSVTTALAPEVARLTAVSPGLGMLAAFSTGILGLWFGKPLLHALRVSDPASRGLCLSCTAHGGAMIALADEPDAFPYAALMFTLGGATTVLLLSFPPFRTFVLALALGPQ